MTELEILAQSVNTISEDQGILIPYIFAVGQMIIAGAIPILAISIYQELRPPRYREIPREYQRERFEF